MPGMNTKKVLVGGLVAAVVCTVIDMVIYGFLLKADMDANMVRLGLDPAVSTNASGIALWLTTEIVFGLLLVWTYAAMRPRFGPGVKTAMYAGMIPWLVIVIVYAGLTQGGMQPASIFWKAIVFGFVSIMAGAVAGAAVYQEEG